MGALWKQSEFIKTDVVDRSKAKAILNQIRRALPGSDPSFDLDDCDKVLRVENHSSGVDKSEVKRILNSHGHQLQVLP